MAKSGPKLKPAANPIWTPELAYACGLMATDGCLYNDGRHMSLTSNDLDQLETFKQCLRLENKIGRKPSGKTGKYGSHVQFGDVALYRWFISIGITPRKTHTIAEIKIPRQFFFDYLRGEFDGDGSSHAYWDSRWHSSVSIYISFACASVKHLIWLDQTIYSLLGISGVVSKKYSSGAHNLRFAKQKSRRLYEAMYYSEIIPYLHRKKEKLDRQWQANLLAKEKKQPVGFVRDGSILRIA